MGILRRFKASLATYTQKWLRGEDCSDENGMQPIIVDESTALKYSAVFACVRVRSETFASCPPVLYKKNAKGEREAVNDLPVYDILHNAPNDEMNPYSFAQMGQAQVDLGGNLIAKRLVNARNQLVGLYPYRWGQVKIDRDGDGALVYTVSGDGNKRETLSRSEVLHVPGLSMDGVTGLTPLSYMGSAIALGLSYQEFGVAFYRNSANPGLAITHPNSLGDEAFERLKKDLRKNYAGMAKTGTPILLEDGMTVKELTITPADAQMIESKAFSIEDIARFYRVPQHLINKLDRSTNNNIEHQGLEFVMYTMLPLVRSWEGAINAQLLTPAQRRAGYYVEYKLDGLLRGDQKSRAEAYAQGRQWGWLSVNDIRRLENLPAIENGDRYLEPANMIEAGKEPNESNQQARLLDEIAAMLERR